MYPAEVGPSRKKSISAILTDLGSEYFARHPKMVSTVVEATNPLYQSEPSIGLPQGWGYKNEPRSDGKLERRYLSPNGHSLRSKPAMLEYLKFFPDQQTWEYYFGASNSD